jgi:dTDP-glucose 4,6-dehydratase
MKRILITGGSGFIGHHVIEHILKNTDWEIVNITRTGFAGSDERLHEIEIWKTQGHRVANVWHDLRSPINEFVDKKIGNVQYVIHMAALSHVDRSIEQPMEALLDNTFSTINFLDWFRKRKKDNDGGFDTIQKFIYFSTDEVFGPALGGINHPEGYRHNPSNPYAAGKAAAEDFCIAYANTYKLPIMITNTMNVFGERQHPEKFIPLTIKKILNGEKVIIHSDATKKIAGSRFYIHARNAAEAMVWLFENGNEFLDIINETNGKFNIVGEKEVTNLELAQFIARVLNKPLQYEMVDFHSSRPGHDLRYALEGKKLHDMGFEYPKTFEESLTKVITWTVNHSEWLGMK